MGRAASRSSGVTGGVGSQGEAIAKGSVCCLSAATATATTTAAAAAAAAPSDVDLQAREPDREQEKQAAERPKGALNRWNRNNVGRRSRAQHHSQRPQQQQQHLSKLPKAVWLADSANCSLCKLRAPSSESVCCCYIVAEGNIPSSAPPLSTSNAHEQQQQCSSSGTVAGDNQRQQQHQKLSPTLTTALSGSGANCSSRGALADSSLSGALINSPQQCVGCDSDCHCANENPWLNSTSCCLVVGGTYGVRTVAADQQQQQQVDLQPALTDATCTCCTAPAQTSLNAPATNIAAAPLSVHLANVNSANLQVSSCSSLLVDSKQQVKELESHSGQPVASLKPLATQLTDTNSSSLIWQRSQTHLKSQQQQQQQQQRQCFSAATANELDSEQKQQRQPPLPRQQRQRQQKECQPYVTLIEGDSKLKAIEARHSPATINESPRFAKVVNASADATGKKFAAAATTTNSNKRKSSQKEQMPKVWPNGKPSSLESKLTSAISEGMGRPQDGNNNSSGSADGEINIDNQEWNHMDWKGIASRYGQLPRQRRSQFWWRMRQSCFCQLLVSSLDALFPILSSFKSYSLPGDFITDIVAGFTIAVLHIPQGMAYGMLAGVEPIYGLYVSFVPVLIMALMSKSRHVSYGTFAVISMLLVNAAESVKELLKQQVVTSSQQQQQQQQKIIAEPLASSSSSPPSVASSVPLVEPTQQPAAIGPSIMAGNELGGLVLTNNHHSVDSVQQQQSLLLKNLLTRSVATGMESELGVEKAVRIFGLNLNSNSSVTASSLPPSDAVTVASTAAGGLSWLTSSSTDSVGGLEFIPSNIEILTCICILVGLIQMIMALMRLGILSLMFSDQLVSSFTTASAVHVVTSQIGGLFDMTLPLIAEGTFRVFRVWWVFANKLTEGFNQYTALLSLTSVLFLLSVKEIIEPILRKRFKSLTCLPSELFLMSFLIFSSWFWQFNEVYDIRIIGNVPTGLPAPQLPRLELAPLVIEDALTVALVSFAMNLSLAQVYAKKYRYTMDPNQELFALGTANFVGSFFSCFPCASSLSRSAVQSNLNVRSQLCSLFSCAIVVAIICYFAPILHDLPRSTLCCIIIVALKGILVQVKDLYENWRLSKLDAFVWIATFMSVLAFGVTYGLVLGIVASLFMIFFRLLTPNHSILGQLPGTEIYVDSNAFVECNEIEQVKIFRFNSALCYLNRTMFKSRVEKSLPSIYKQQGFNLFCSTKQKAYLNDSNKVKFLVIDCSALAYCDYSGAATLVDIIEELEEHKLSAYLAACPLKLINMIEKMQKTTVLEQNVYPSITDAVTHAKYLRCITTTTTSQQGLQSGSFLPGGNLPAATSNVDGSLQVGGFN